MSEIPTELTTAATNIILGAAALTAGLITRSRGTSRRSRIWSSYFLLTALAGLLGTLVHGLSLSPAIKNILWQPLLLILAAGLSCFMAGIIHDIRGPQLPTSLKRSLWLMPFIFYLATLVLPGSFVIILGLAALASLAGIAGYHRLAGQGQQGTRLMEIGLGISFLAAALQTDHDLQLNLIWLFDHNGIFHLGHTAGIITFASGLYRSQKSPENISAKLQA